MDNPSNDYISEIIKREGGNTSGPEYIISGEMPSRRADRAMRIIPRATATNVKKPCHVRMNEPRENKTGSMPIGMLKEIGDICVKAP